jgi:anti-anti-sigma regulatory factor
VAGQQPDAERNGRDRVAKAARAVPGADSSCLRVLCQVSRMAEEAGGSLGLAAPQPVVAWGMELWGAGQVIRVHDSLAKAVIAAGE